MSGLIRLCQASEVEEDLPRRVEPVGSTPLAVYRAGEAFYVTSDICTHGKASLCDGIQEGTTIECPSHGGVFDIRTGEAVQFPCRIPLKTYPVVIEDGWICVEIQAEP